MGANTNVSEVSESVAHVLILDADVSALTNNVGFLIGQARMYLWNLLNRETVTELNITNAQASMLYLVCGGEANSMKALAESCGMDAGATTRLIARLEQLQLVRRAKSNKDRRVITVSATKKGIELAQKLPAVLERVIDSALQSFGEHEVLQLREMLERLLSNCRKMDSKRSIRNCADLNYSHVRNIANRLMPKEGAYKVCVSANL